MPSFVMHLAIRFLKMEPEEILTAYTVNSAYLLGFTSGIVRPGYPADLVLWKLQNFWTFHTCGKRILLSMFL